MNVIDIVTQYLKDNGYDGLVEDTGECGCELSDLMPCEIYSQGCRAGHKEPDPAGEYDWLIFPGKKEELCQNKD